MKRKYWQITTEGSRATINIYGDITSWKWFDSDVSAYDIKQEIDLLNVTDIDVFINSYGGEVAEALAIYSALKRNKAAVHTYCDGFACSAATIIFAAGDTRTMGAIALLMIHNCMSYVGYANSEELRKAADDNDKINQSSIEAYKAIANIDEDQIRELMDDETWITAKEALEWGFATDIADQEEDEGEAVQSARRMIFDMLTKQKGSEDSPSERLLEMMAAAQAKFDKVLAALQAEADPDDDPDDPDDDDPEDPDDDDQDDGDPQPEENATINNFFNIFK